MDEYQQTRFIRDIFTGELVERPLLPSGNLVHDASGNLVPAKVPERSSRAAICEKNPWESRSLAVNPGQVEDFNRDLREAGVRGAQYDRKSGNLVCTSRSARKKAVRLRGFHDNDGGYSDP